MKGSPRAHSLKTIGSTKQTYYNMFQNQFGINLEDIDLSLAELNFLGHICANGFNSPGESYKQTGFVYKGDADAHVRGLRLMQDTRIRLAVTRVLESILAPYRERLEYQLLTTWYNRAFYNFKDYYCEKKNDDGSFEYVMKPMSELSDEQIEAIDGVEFGKNPRYVLAKRQDALSSLRDILFEAQKDKSKESIKEEHMRKISGVFEKLESDIKTAKEDKRKKLSESDDSDTSL